MSVESLAIAFNHSRARGTARMVLLGIANHDGDGGAWPAIATLAKYAGVDVRNARRAVVKLEELGEIRRDINGGGTQYTAEHERPNLYHFLLRCPADCDGTRKHRTRRDTLAVELLPERAPRAEAPGGAVAPGEPRAEAPAEPPTNHPDRSRAQSNPSTREREKGMGACGHPLVPERPQYCVMGCSPSQVNREEAR